MARVSKGGVSAYSRPSRVADGFFDIGLKINGYAVYETTVDCEAEVFTNLGLAVHDVLADLESVRRGLQRTASQAGLPCIVDEVTQ